MSSGLRVQPQVSGAAVARHAQNEPQAGARRPQLLVAARDGFDRAAPKAVVLGTLRRGSTGAEVRGLQAKLQMLGLMSAADVKSGPGVYGPRTELAVKRFQARLQGRVDLPVTGIADAATRRALLAAERRDVEATGPMPAVTRSDPASRTITDEDDDEPSRSEVTARLQT